MIVVIPARYASTRLPGKPLADIAGKSLIQRVHERARESGAASVIVATDDERIRTIAQAFGAQVCMTNTKHRSGTERLAEVIEKLQINADEIVVNVQGDEPDISPKIIEKVAELLEADTRASVATVCCPIVDRLEFENPNVVKVVCNEKGYAMYFSRAPIPWPRDTMARKLQGPIRADRHIGIYAYRAGYLSRYVGLPSAPLEELEQLEQLRTLWNGDLIAVCRIRTEEAPTVSVDTRADLERAVEYFKRPDS